MSAITREELNRWGRAIVGNHVSINGVDFNEVVARLLAALRSAEQLRATAEARGWKAGRDAAALYLKLNGGNSFELWQIECEIRKLEPPLEAAP